MNILFVGHDISYVRFYAAIESALRQHTKVTSLHIYFRPSAWLYARFALRLQALSPSLIRLFGRWSANHCTDTKLLDLRFYQIPEDQGSHSQFARLYSTYRRFIQQALGDSNFDIAILPGEYRIFEQATIAALKSVKQPPQVIYFEAGPSGYIYLDKNGVNANASFADTGVSQLISNVEFKAVLPSKVGVMLPRPLRLSFLALDVAWLWLANKMRGLLDLEEYWVATRNRLSHSLQKKSLVNQDSTIVPTGNCVIFLAQVRNDINHTHFGVDDAELEQRLVGLLRCDLSLKLIWRDHPLEVTGHIFLRLSAEFPDRVSRMGPMPLQQALASADGVVTVNSNGGLEALAVGLPVRLLGRSYFACLNGVCIDDLSFQILRKRVRDQGPVKNIRRDAARFLRVCFLQIDYRGNDFHNVDLAAQVILSCKP